MNYAPAYLGNYRVVGPLGAGGCAQVFRARHIVLDRDVAIKVLADDLAGSLEARARFVDEARALATLSHPNVVDVHDFALDSAGRPYFVMELARGPTLANYITCRDLTIREVLDIASALADAVAAVHDAGILHRDIKTENVVIEVSGDEPGDKPRPVLIDFGIARSTASPRRANTLDRVAMGTPRSMAPEQITGGPVDERTDIWGFGVLLYELLTGGISPFESPGDVDRTLRGAMTSSYAPLPVWVPPTLRILVAQCLAKLPDERPQSMRAIRDELANIVEDITAAEDAFDRSLESPLATAPQPAPQPADDPYVAYEVWSPSGSRIAAAGFVAIVIIGAVGTILTAVMNHPSLG